MELVTIDLIALLVKKTGVLYERGCVIQQTFDYASSKPSIDGTLFWDYGYCDK